MYIKLQIPAGKATPAPPVGPALGQHGVNIMSFTKEFNERTQKDIGYLIPVVITVYADRSFSFITKTPPAAVLIKKAIGIESGSGAPNKTKVASITRKQLEEIANSFEGVEKSFAVQAGREIRIIVKPEVVSEEATVLMAKDIAKRIETDMVYPGQIKVNVVRETRKVEYAK